MLIRLFRFASANSNVAPLAEAGMLGTVAWNTPPTSWTVPA